MICCWAACKDLFWISEFISVLRCSPACFAFCNAVICAAGNCIHCRGSAWNSLKVLYYSLFSWVCSFVCWGFFFVFYGFLELWLKQPTHIGNVEWWLPEAAGVQNGGKGSQGFPEQRCLTWPHIPPPGSAWEFHSAQELLQVHCP